MERWQRFKRTFPKVEIITFGIIIEVGKEAHEHGKTEHEHQMEVGITVLAAIQPLEATHNIVEKRTVILLSPRGIIDKLSQEHADGNLIHRSEEHTSELQSRQYLVCRLLLDKQRGPGRLRVLPPAG